MTNGMQNLALNTLELKQMKKTTHVALIRGCDARTPDNYRAEVFLRETKNFWITSKGIKYKKPDGSGLGDWPMSCIILQSIKPLPTHTATLVKNEKVQDEKIAADFNKKINLWNIGLMYQTIFLTCYSKDGYPVVTNRPVKIDTNTIQPFAE